MGIEFIEIAKYRCVCKMVYTIYGQNICGPTHNLSLLMPHIWHMRPYNAHAELSTAVLHSAWIYSHNFLISLLIWR